ncbi:hypothetical protein ABPG74_015295 [Tetrahymena malaccensis]
MISKSQAVNSNKSGKNQEIQQQISHTNYTKLLNTQNEEVSNKTYEEDELIYYDLFSECQDYVIESCLAPLEYKSLQKTLPVGKLTKFNQALLQNIQRQIYQQLQIRLKKKLSLLQEKYQIKDQLVKIQMIKQEQQVLQELGFSDNIVDQDENQVFFELLLKNMKLLTNDKLISQVEENQQKDINFHEADKQ